MAVFRKNRKRGAKQSTDVRYSDRGFAYAELGSSDKITGVVPHYSNADRPQLPDTPPGVLIYNLDMGCLQLSDPDNDQWLNICGLPYNAGVVAGSGLLGYPTDGTYTDGVLPLSPSGTVADAIDQINELLVQCSCIVYASHLGQTDGATNGVLIPPSFTPGRVATPTSEGSPYYTGAWDTDTNKSLTNQSNLVWNPPAGEKITDLQAGEINLVFTNGNGSIIHTEILIPNGTTADQVSTPSGYIQLSSLNTYGFKIEGFVNIDLPITQLLSSGSGYLKVESRQVAGANIYTSTPLIFFKDSGNTPTILSQSINLQPGCPVKYLSGIKFATISGGVYPELLFNLSGNAVWRDTYRADPLFVESTEFGIPNEVVNYNDSHVTKNGITPPVIPFKYNEDFIYSEAKDIGTGIVNPDANGVYRKVRFTIRDPFTQTVGSYVTTTDLINTVTANTSNDYSEMFYDEEYRLKDSSSGTGYMSSIHGSGRGLDAWDSSTSLILTPALQAINGSLIYPKQDFSPFYPNTNPDYSSLGIGVGNLIYTRRFRQPLGDARSNGVLRIVGLSEADRLSGNILIDLRVVGDHIVGNGIQDIGNEGTGWLSLNTGYNSGTFLGDDGDGCFVTTNGKVEPYFEFTLGGFSTAFAYNQAIELRITYKDPAALNKKITLIQIGDWA